MNNNTIEEFIIKSNDSTLLTIYKWANMTGGITHENMLLFMIEALIEDKKKLFEMVKTYRLTRTELIEPNLYGANEPEGFIDEPEAMEHPQKVAEEKALQSIKRSLNINDWLRKMGIVK